MEQKRYESMKNPALPNIIRRAVPIAALAAVAALLTGCAVQPVPGQSSIISRLPSDYAYAPPTQTEPVDSQPIQSEPLSQAPAQPAAPVPQLSEQERQQYATIDKQVQRDQAQEMAAYQAAQAAWYYPSYYPAYYPAYYSAYYPAYYPYYPRYYASPVVYGGYYGGWGRGGCCWGGGTRWSVGVGYGWGW